MQEGQTGQSQFSQFGYMQNRQEGELGAQREQRSEELPGTSKFVSSECETQKQYPQG